MERITTNEIKSKKDLKNIKSPADKFTQTTPALITTPVDVPFISPEQAMGEVEEIEEMFSGEGATESSILKELFNGKNVKLKTQLSGDEISIVSRLYLMARITKRPYLHNILDEFITLRVSMDRQSRKEFVEAHKDRQTAQNKGLLGGLLGGQQ